VVDQLFHQRGNVERISADADRRDQILQQRFDGRPDPMRKRFAPSGESAVGLDLDQYGFERLTFLAGKFRR
jgi:hypothetical protein